MFSRKVNFNQCPMYDKAGHNYTRLSQLEKNIKEIKSMQKQQTKSLDLHMEEEIEHHRKTRDILQTMTNTVDKLVDDNKNHREQQKKGEILKNKIYVTIVGALTLSFTYWFLDILTHLEQVNKILGAE